MPPLTPDGLRFIGVQLPEIPEKTFFTIGEIVELSHVEAHVLRFWEGEFAHIKPLKRSGNRRLYRLRDLCAILCIKHLLYTLNFTHQGARQRMNQGDLAQFVEQPDTREMLYLIRDSLKEAKHFLQQ
ncbi:MAG: MerR family transcriptional regulator [Zetaproteobacteria bacterium]|nr:MerR family transcriptional regulator [Zetaproteobacteria bacterium]